MTKKSIKKQIVSFGCYLYIDKGVAMDIFPKEVFFDAVLNPALFPLYLLLIGLFYWKKKI